MANGLRSLPRVMRRRPMAVHNGGTAMPAMRTLTHACYGSITVGLRRGLDPQVEAGHEGTTVLVPDLVIPETYDLLDTQLIQPFAYLADIQRIVVCQRQVVLALALGFATAPLSLLGAPLGFLGILFSLLSSPLGLAQLASQLPQFVSHPL